MGEPSKTFAKPPIEVLPFGGPATLTWAVPGSKSISNRALVLAALVPGPCGRAAQMACTVSRGGRQGELEGCHSSHGVARFAQVDGSTELVGILHSDDTRHMTNALRAMGVGIEATGPTSVLVRGGRKRLHAPEGEVFIGNSGTTARFLAAFAMCVPGHVT